MVSETLKLSAEQAGVEDQLVFSAVEAGIGETLILELIKEFGGKLAGILIKWLTDRKKQNLQLDLSGFKPVKKLLVVLLTQYRDMIIAFADEQVAKAIDLVIAKLSE